MRLRCGLSAPSAAWEQILLQEGFPFGLVDVVRGFDREDWSVVAVTAPPGPAEAKALGEYLAGGGALLGSAAHLADAAGISGRAEFLRYVVGEGGAWDVAMCDIDAAGCVPLEAHTMRTDGGGFALFAGEHRGGAVAALPFDPAAAVMDPRAAVRLFHDDRERLPRERVSRVAKAEVFHLVHGALEVLHHMRGLPYAHLWYFPGTAESVFACRVDTDRGTPQQIDALHAAAREYDLRMSWFLDVRSHEAWLGRFAEMADQEIGVHCYDHRTTGGEPADLKNIRKAIGLMEPHTGRSEGFAGPFGIWNTGLAGAIDAAGFSYSSEFSFAYDALPFFPESGGRRFRALQVPVHPVCIGSMLKAGYDGERMTAYFRRVMERKLLRAEPLFFYHHPTHMHWEVVRAMIRTAREAGVPFMSLGEFARWWRTRLNTRFGFEADGTGIRITTPDRETPLPAEAFGVRCSRSDGTVCVAPAETPVSAGSPAWRPRRTAPVPDDLRRIREPDLRSSLGAIMDSILRYRS